MSEEAEEGWELPPLLLLPPPPLLLLLLLPFSLVWLGRGLPVGRAVGG